MKIHLKGMDSCPLVSCFLRRVNAPWTIPVAWNPSSLSRPRWFQLDGWIYLLSIWKVDAPSFNLRQDFVDTCWFIGRSPRAEWLHHSNCGWLLLCWGLHVGWDFPCTMYRAPESQYIFPVKTCHCVRQIWLAFGRVKRRRVPWRAILLSVEIL